ncbi:MAG TPA: molybdopterin-dependent oxidoreductase [Edaphobacter sp.]
MTPSLAKSKGPLLSQFLIPHQSRYSPRFINGLWRRLKSRFLACSSQAKPSGRKKLWESIDLADALHPQTLLTWAMNDGDLPVSFGGPLRLRVPRQLGYKSVKYITRITATDSLKSFGKGLGSASPEAGYSWYAGI